MQSKDEIQQRIQQLTGAIEKHRMDQTNNRGRGGYANRPMSFSRTWTNNHNRGSPNKSVVFNGTRSLPAPNRNVGSYNKQLVLNKTKASTPAAHEPTIPPSSSPHKKLVLNQTTTTFTPPKPVATPGAPKEIEIGGVKFMVKGKKLIRQDRLKNQPLPSGMAAGSHVVVVRRNKRQVLMDESCDVTTHNDMYCIEQDHLEAIWELSKRYDQQHVVERAIWCLYVDLKDM